MTMTFLGIVLNNAYIKTMQSMVNVYQGDKTNNLVNKSFVGVFSYFYCEKNTHVRHNLCMPVCKSKQYDWATCFNYESALMKR